MKKTVMSTTALFVLINLLIGLSTAKAKKDSQTKCPVAEFKGECAIRGESLNYDKLAYQYGSTSNHFNGMSPKIILVAESDDDVIVAIKYAQKKGTNIAVRSGGHQYSGFSSTSGENIQLDMSRAYRNDFELMPRNRDDKPLVKVGISVRVGELVEKLSKMKMFVPTGVCSFVQLGGHVQTGGYGQMIRAFGTLGDHVQSLDIITADAKKVHVERNSTDEDMQDLYYALLGGSPGNFGVLTHVTLELNEDKDFPQSRALRAGIPYDKEMLRKLSEMMIDMYKRDRDFDFSVTVLSTDIDMFKKHSNTKHGEPSSVNSRAVNETDPASTLKWPPIILVLAQWSNTGGAQQKPDEAIDWLKSINDTLGNVPHYPVPMKPINPWTEHTPLSQLCVGWLLAFAREFPLPYEKRVYITKKINSPKWPEWVSNRLDIIQSQDQPDYQGKRLGLKAAAQIQSIGGPKSMHYLNGLRKSANGNNLTAYSWRTFNTAAIMDVFYNKTSVLEADQNALEWTRTNDKEGFGPNGMFSNVPLDRNQRFLWATYGDRNMGNVWQHYYTPEQYKRLVRIKNKWDPAPTTFIANQFCVGVAPNSEDIPPANNSASISSSIFPQIAALQHVPSSAAKGLDAAELLQMEGSQIAEVFKQSEPLPVDVGISEVVDEVFTKVVEDSQRPVDEEEL